MAGCGSGARLRRPCSGRMRRSSSSRRGWRPSGRRDRRLRARGAHGQGRFGRRGRPRRRLRRFARSSSDLAPSRAGDPPDAHALGERRSLRHAHVPGPRGARCDAAAGPPATRRVGDRPLPPHGRALPRARGRGAARVRLGRIVRPGARAATASGRGRLRGRRARDVPPRAPRAGPPGPARAAGAGGRRARRACVRASRVRGSSGRRRRGNGGRNRMAERERGRRRGDRGATARAAPQAAEPAAPPVHEARPRHVPPTRRRVTRRVPAVAVDAVVSAGAAVGCSRADRRRDPRCGGSGDLRDRVPTGVRARSASVGARSRARARARERLARAGRRRDGARAHRRGADARCLRRSCAVGVPRRRHARRNAVRRAPVREAMSYTLRGRLESRLAAVLLPFGVAIALAAALPAWWPVQLAALMIAVGITLDAAVYHPLLRYQPGWFALPLGGLELVLVTALAFAFDVAAPLDAAVAFFAASWLWAQILGHAALPLLRAEYAEDGGELARAGTLAAAGVASAFVLVGGVAWATQPPVVHLHGVVQGPLVLDHEQTLVGGVVRGGIVITADGVTVRGTTTIGGDDGIHARRSGVVIENCNVLAGPGTQGVDVSFAMHEHSEIAGCRVAGGVSGIEVHYTMASIRDNVVVGSGISLTEMSMGSIEDNAADSIYCGDWSLCEIEGNAAASIRVNANSDARVRDN